MDSANDNFTNECDFLLRKAREIIEKSSPAYKQEHYSFPVYRPFSNPPTLLIGANKK